MQHSNSNIVISLNSVGVIINIREPQQDTEPNPALLRNKNSFEVSFMPESFSENEC